MGRLAGAPWSFGASHEPFHHEALFFGDQDEFLSGIAEFIREGLEADEPVLAVLDESKIGAVRAELGVQSERVLFADLAELGANPARMIPAWRAFVDSYPPTGRRVRGIGEPIWAERGPAELAEWQRHESLLNLAFADTQGFRLLCPYDTSSLDEDVLQEARRSHPHLTAGRAKHQSDEYRKLDELAAPLSDPLPEPRQKPDFCVFQAGTLAPLRAFVGRHAAAAGLSAEAGDDLVLAVNEVATNSVVYGGSGGILRVWTEADSLVCEVGDRGHIDDPLVGRRCPAPDQVGGYGVWIANHLCDVVQVRTYPGGSVVRLHKRRR